MRELFCLLQSRAGRDIRQALKEEIMSKRIYILETYSDDMGWEIGGAYQKKADAIRTMKDRITNEEYKEYDERDHADGLVAHLTREDDAVTTAMVHWRVVQ
jgi:hypothetical protein